MHWASCFTRCSRVASPTRGQPSRSFGSSVCCARPSRCTGSARAVPANWPRWLREPSIPSPRSAGRRRWPSRRRRQGRSRAARERGQHDPRGRIGGVVMGRPDFGGPRSRELHSQPPPLERPVRCPPSSGRAILLLLASAIPSAAAAQRAPVPRYTIEQFMNTTSMVGASFSPDERAILVTSNQSGVFNAYEIPAGGGKPQARTHSTADGIFTVGYLPHDRRVLYLQGTGGNENDHLYLLDTTGTARDLTPGDSLKAVFVDWTGDDSSFYYATNGRDRRFFDVYEMPVATLTPRLVFRDTVGYQVAAISSDRHWMALQRPLTTQKDRKSTRLNSSHSQISYAVFCLKKKKKDNQQSSNSLHQAEP